MSYNNSNTQNQIFSESDIQQQKSKVQRLANQVHSAKVKLDELMWGAGGFSLGTTSFLEDGPHPISQVRELNRMNDPTDPKYYEALRNCFEMARWRKKQGSAREIMGDIYVSPNFNTSIVKDSHIIYINYQKLRAQWIIAKAELDWMQSFKQVPDIVKAIRDELNNRFGPDIQAAFVVRAMVGIDGTGTFGLSQEPELRQRGIEVVDEAVKNAKTKKTIGSVVVATETIAAAWRMTLEDSKCKQAFKEVATIAKEIALKAAQLSQNNPNSIVLKKAAIQAEALSQGFGN